MTTAIGATAAAGDGGVSTGFWVGAGIVALVLVGVGGVVMVRRRSTVGERE